MSAGAFIKEMQSLSWAANGKSSVQIKGAPKRRRVTHIGLWLSATVANTSGGNLIVYPGALAEVLNRCFIESDLFKLRATGRMLQNMYHHRTGKQLYGTPGTTINNSASGTVSFFTMVPLSDPVAASPHDTSIPSELLEDLNLEVDFSDGATLGDTAGVAVSAATLRTYLHTIEGAQGFVPTPSRIDYVDWSGQTAYPIPKGAISHLMVYDESDQALVPTTEYTRFTLEGDGVKLIDNVNVESLYADWNDKFGQGASVGGVTEVDASATTTPSEQLNAASAPFIPLVSPSKGYKLTQLIYAEDNFRVDYSGSVTSARFAYRVVGERQPEQEVRALAKMGEPEPARRALAVKTLSKTDLAGDPRRVARHSRLLPKRAA